MFGVLDENIVNRKQACRTVKNDLNIRVRIFKIDLAPTAFHCLQPTKLWLQEIQNVHHKKFD